jgi:hypothetical protein
MNDATAAHTVTFDGATLICTPDEVPAVLRALDNHTAGAGDRPPIILRIDQLSVATAPHPQTARGLAELLRAATGQNH